jgi:hypothetical protein
VPAGALQEALNASDDMKSIMGMFDASLGARSNETSGRAIIARQREGDVSSFHFIDNLNRAIRHAGRIIIDLIPKIYSTERVLRVIGEDESTQMVRVNQDPQRAAMQAMEEGREIAKIYDLTVGKYDVEIQTGPSFTTQRQEAANSMIEFIRAYPPAAGLIGDLLAKNLDWPGAEDMAKRLKAMLPPQIQQGEDGEQNAPDPRAMQAIQAMRQQTGAMQQQLQQGAQAFAQLQQENQQLKAKQMEAMAQAELKARELSIKEQEARVKAYEAETERMQAVHQANPWQMG